MQEYKMRDIPEIYFIQSLIFNPPKKRKNRSHQHPFFLIPDSFLQDPRGGRGPGVGEEGRRSGGDAKTLD